MPDLVHLDLPFIKILNLFYFLVNYSRGLDLLEPGAQIPHDVGQVGLLVQSHPEVLDLAVLLPRVVHILLGD